MAKPKQKTAMISSTARDLPEHRGMVMDACLRCGFRPLMMDHLAGQDRSARDVSIGMVEDANVYLGIFAYAYGSSPANDPRSYTEIEFDQAVGLGITVIPFFMDEHYPWPPSLVDKGENAKKLERLKEKVAKGRTVQRFKSPEDLRGFVIQALSEFEGTRAKSSREPRAARMQTGPKAKFHDLREPFSIGGIALDFKIACWAPEGIPENRIHRTRIETAPFASVPEPLAVRFAKLQQDAEDFVAYRGEWTKKPTQPTDVRFNGKAYTLIRADWYRDAEENLYLELGFKASDFIRRRATRQLFLLPGGVSAEERDILCKRIQEPGEAVDERYCGGFGAVIAVITPDRTLAFFRRSPLVAGDIGAWDCSCVEGAALNDEREERSDGNPPDPYRNAERALWQEANLRAVDFGTASGRGTGSPELYRRNWLRLHALGCRMDTYEWAMYGVFDLRTVGTGLRQQWSDQIAESARLAQDSFEFDLATFIPFDPRNVVEFICNQYVTDYSVVSACLALMVGGKGDPSFRKSVIDAHFRHWHNRNAELQMHLNTLGLADPALRTDGRMDRRTWDAIVTFWTKLLGRERKGLKGVTEPLRKEVEARQRR